MSSGHNCLSRLSTEGLKRVLISWLLCTVLWFLYLLVLILITSFTYGISKLLCKVWLETYEGALLIILSIFDWNVWRILLHPHSSIPYVHMGRSIVLYTVSLLFRDNCERVFISQLIFWAWVPVGIVWLLCASSALVFRLGEVPGILLLFWQVCDYCEDLLADRYLVVWWMLPVRTWLDQQWNIQLGKKSDSRHIRPTGPVLAITAAKHVMEYCLMQQRQL